MNPYTDLISALKVNSILDSILSNAREGMCAEQGRNMSDLDDLLQMDLNNCFVKHIHLRVGKSCALSLLHGPVSRNGQDVTEELEIEFSQLIAVIADLRMEPWLEILDHELLEQSTYLQEKDFKEAEKLDPFHFWFRCDEGTLDIIARQFSFISRQETPCFATGRFTDKE